MSTRNCILCGNIPETEDILLLWIFPTPKTSQPKVFMLCSNCLYDAEEKIAATTSKGYLSNKCDYCNSIVKNGRQVFIDRIKDSPAPLSDVYYACDSCAQQIVLKLSKPNQ